VFEPGRDGIFREAEVLPVPWLDRSYAWEGIAIARDGTLYLAGSTEAYGPGLLCGSLLMRQPDGSWRIAN